VDTADAPVLVLGGRWGVDGTHDIYEASLRDGDGEDRPGLIVKLVDLLQLPVRGYPNQTTAISELCNTAVAFGLLQPLQGTIVPRFAGLFAHGTIYCTVFEDAGRPLTDAEKMDKRV
jgi:hypothetical protein